MKRRSLKLLPLLSAGLVFAGCEGTFAGVEDEVLRSNGPSYQVQETVCETVTFDAFAHGDPVTSQTVFGVPLTLTGVRYTNSGGSLAADPTAYDVELTGADLAALNATHDDTQAERDCADCVGHGSILVVPDANFPVGGDNTFGGEINISGFAADVDATWSIEAFDVVDADVDQGFTRLYVDAALTAINTLTGNATVETVAVPANTIGTDIEFIIGEFEDASGGIDNLVLCRTTEQEGGEGCTPGYWKQEHHFDSWTAPYDPTDFYDEVFGVGPHITLLAALESGGGGVNALLRHSVAGLLSAASPDVDYGMSVAAIVSLVQSAFDTSNFESAKNTLEDLNEQFCPLN